MVDQLLEQLAAPRAPLPPTPAAASASAGRAATALVAKLLPAARTVLESIVVAKASAIHGQAPVHVAQGPRGGHVPAGLGPAVAAVVEQRVQEAGAERAALLQGGAEAFAALRGRGFAALAEALPSLPVPVSQRNNQVRS